MDSFQERAMSKRFIVNLGLERIQILLDKLGNPQDKLKIIHIAGTNGKGSVCAFLQSILTGADFKVGLYSSPELCDIHERISIDKKNISDSDLSILLSRIEKASSSMNETPSPFEIWTAAAYLYFFEQKCDYAIIEVGMGGTSDATNVIKKPLQSIITSVSMDHMDYLGDTLESIARHKCGIIKDGCPVITTSKNECIMGIISSCAAVHSSDIHIVEPLLHHAENASEICLVDGIETPLGIGGENQAENAALAAFSASLLGVDSLNIAKGLAASRHKGRFEILCNNPLVIFDGAHNPSGAESLCVNIRRYFPDKRFTIIFAAMGDKDISSVLKSLSPLADRFVFTTVALNKRAATRQMLFDIATKLNLSYSYCNSLSAALNSIHGKSENILIAGSLYLYKDLLQCGPLM